VFVVKRLAVDLLSSVWIVMKEEEEKARRQYARADAQRQKVAAEELTARRAEIRREIASGNETR
jgi:hypothetical protein